MDKLILGAAYLAKGIIAGAVIYGIVLIILMITGRRKRGFSKLRCIGEYLFVVYLMTVFSITGVANVLQWKMQMNTINLVPFVNEEPRLILLNLALFIPLGVFVPLVFSGGKWNLLKITAVGFAVSMVIELMQLFVVGRPLPN